jgi:hypothetical protein
MPALSRHLAVRVVGIRASAALGDSRLGGKAGAHHAIEEFLS